MAALRPVGALWLGDRFSWLERLCLGSVVAQGHAVTLFTYGPVSDLPAGITLRDARDILPESAILRHERRDHPGIFADRFRPRMLRACPGMIWVDCDLFCLAPLQAPGGWLMVRDGSGNGRLGTAVLAMPARSRALSRMIAMTEDPLAVSDWIGPERVAALRAAEAAGNPVPVTRQPWGVWGPRLLGHLVEDLGLEARVAENALAYPIPYADRDRLVQPAAAGQGLLAEDTVAVHLWSSALRGLDAAPAGSFVAWLAAGQPGKDPAGLTGPAVVAPPAAVPAQGGSLLDRLGTDPVSSFADLGGGALDLAIAAHTRWECDVILVDLLPAGGFAPGESAWLAGYRAALCAAGVPESRIHKVTSAAGLKPWDVIANLQLFGDRGRISHLTPLFGSALHADSRVICDLRKGSGGFPFLRRLGTTEDLGAAPHDPAVTRVLFRPDPPEPATAGDPAWSEIARGLAGRDGFFRDLGGHSFLFMPRSSDTLVVTFDNLDLAMNKRDDRRPWGFSFIEKQGWSMLGVMAGGWTWYRDPLVWAEFDALRDSGFFARFKRVVFYGASMGGYAAAAFSAACPGADVVAISPQSTLDKSLVPWETRYRTAWGRDFSGPYGDAAQVSHAARRVILFHDPYEPLDSGHARRFTASNVLHLRAPLLGHRLGSSLQQMGILAPLILAALDGSLMPGEFYRHLRARRAFPRYQRELFERALARGRPGLARRVALWVLARGNSPEFRTRLARL